tara:strand:- start:243 stop:635 length:393 start_codon:yes stop_codon:yes gene_type:complete
MTAQTILNKINKARNSGQDKWRVQCPVHNGKDFNMSIKECQDGTVLAHCFVCGADGPQLCEALGLPLSEIFPPDDNYVRPVITSRMKQQALEDEFVISIASQQPKLTLEDKRRVRLAKCRLEGIGRLKTL